MSYMRASLIILAMSGGLFAASQATAQQTDGGAIFRQRCQMCHVSVSTQKTGLGPNLARVVGRRAASTAFAYSTALKASALTWDKPTLDRFLTAPMKMVPGTRMVMAVPNGVERGALIGYLATLRK